MPLLIYGADLHDEAVELTIDNFVHLIDDTSWTEFMPAGVTKADFARFKRYYDPEVFSAAGRRIRQLARSADKFTIEERISRLVHALFHLSQPRQGNRPHPLARGQHASLRFAGRLLFYGRAFRARPRNSAPHRAQRRDRSCIFAPKHRVGNQFQERSLSSLRRL